MIPGQVFSARYELLRAIGRGGMGEVWRGHDQVLRRDVAVKVLDPAAADDRAAARFQREAAAAAALSHPSVVSIYDAGVEHGLSFLVMELLPGPTVADLIKQHGQLSVDRTVDLIRQAAQGLDAIHRVGVVHRDVKPSNLMLDQHGQLRVVDFGIAQMTEQPTTDMTASGTVLGSAAYLSPEQARGETATAASDHYALGCVLMAMLTGQPPFAAEHPVALLRHHLDTPPPRVRDRRPDVPGWLDQVVDDLLAKDPGQRAAGVAALLENSAVSTPPTGLATTAVLPTTEVSGGASSAGRTRRPRALLAASAAIVAILAISGVVLTLAREDNTDGDQGSTEARSTNSPDESTSLTPSATSTPSASSAPSDQASGLSAAVEGLNDAVQQTLTEGGIDQETAEDLDQRISDLDDWVEQGNLAELDKKLDELDKRIEELVNEDKLDATGAARIRQAIDAVRETT